MAAIVVALRIGIKSQTGLMRNKRDVLVLFDVIYQRKLMYFGWESPHTLKTLLLLFTNTILIV